MNPGLPTAILVFILIGIAFSSSDVPRSKLVDWQGPKKNLMRFPHPNSCVHFLLIKPDGSHVVKKCNDEEIFDFQSLQCRDRASAKCWKDVNQRVVFKKPKKNFLCPFPWGLYPDIDDCSHFHECLGGTAYLRKCPEYTAFDKAERTCVPAKEAMCPDESDIVEPGYRCPYKWGYFPHPKDCSKYYECLQRVPTIWTCKRNMLFDNLERRCILMKDVKCGIRFNPYETRHYEATTEKPKATYPITGYTAVTEQPRTGYTTGTKYPITGYTAATEQPRTGYTTGTKYPITGYTAATEQSRTGYTYTESPKTGYTTVTDRLITGYTAATELPGTGYTTGTKYPITGYTAATEQPRTGYTAVTEHTIIG